MTLKPLIIALAVSGSMLAAQTATALPAAPSAPAGIAHAQDLQQVHYRGGYYGGYYRGYRGGYWRGGRWIGLGIGAAIVGSAIAADRYYYRPYRYYSDDAVQRCIDTYRSFDPRSGTYMGYDGVRHVCPYL